MNRHKLILLCILLFAGVFCMGSHSATAATADDFTPTYHPSLTISKTDRPIKVDGYLNDPGWEKAGRSDNFAEHYPGDQTRPPVKTVALITYDDHNLYVAFMCYDDPNLVRASFSDRDRLYNDDNVGFFFDTYNEASWAYILNVNPYGIQADAIWSQNGGEDNRYDLIWESAGQITDSGYQVEMAIPFSSLRFPNVPAQTWKVDFWRNHPREYRRQYSWAAYDRNDPCWPCKWGTVTGLKNIHPGKGIELLPAFVGHQFGELAVDDDPDSGFTNNDAKGELSLGAKYTLSSDMTLEATYNPDFSQVESDAAQIDVNTTFALFYSEKRPFFQEGSDLFQTDFNSFHSRSINDPQFALKLTGRFNRASIAFLAAYDENSPVILPFEEFSESVARGKSYSGTLRARYVLGEESHIGLIASDRYFDGGGFGALAGIDGSLRLAQNYYCDFQAVTSHTDEPDDSAITIQQWDDSLHWTLFDNNRHTIGYDGEYLRGHGVRANFRRSARHWNFGVGYLEFSPTLRFDLGFEPRNNRREIDINTSYTFYLDSKIISRISPTLILGRVWNFNNEKKDEWAIGQLDMQLPGQTSVELSYMESWERLRGYNFARINRLRAEIESDFSEAVGLGMSALKGHVIYRRTFPAVLGSEVLFSFWGYIKPTDRIRIEPEIEYDKSIDPGTDETLFEVLVERTKLNVQFSRRLFMRLIVQYDDDERTWEIDPLVTYRINPFSLFYIGSTYDYKELYSDAYDRDETTLTRRQYFVKLQYLFQL